MGINAPCAARLARARQAGVVFTDTLTIGRMGLGYGALTVTSSSCENAGSSVPFYAIVTAQSDLDRAAAAIFVAMVFDFLDGRAVPALTPARSRPRSTARPVRRGCV